MYPELSKGATSNFQGFCKMSSGRNQCLLEGLALTEKMFQAKMRRIYEKYDHAFEDDIVVNIIDFTYSAPDGPIPWDFSAKATGERKHTPDTTQEREHNNTFILACAIGDISSDSSEDDLNITYLFPMETSDGNLSRTFIIGEQSKSDDSHPAELEHCKFSYTTGNLSLSIKLSAGTKEACFPDGHTQSLMPYNGSNIGNKTFFVSPLDTSVSMQKMSFIKRQSKDCSFEDTRELSYNDYKTDVSGLHRSREDAYARDTNLAYYYPNMVECIRRLWELPWKKRAADNIVQFYKRHVWNAHKKLSTKQRFNRHSREYETTKGCSRYTNTVCRRKRVKKSSFMESAVHSPENKTFTVNSSKDCTLITLDNVVTKQNKVDTHEIGSCIKDQNRQLSVMKYTPAKRNICSMFPLIYSPKAKSKVACSTVDDRTIILEETFTCQNQIETDDANSSSYRNNIGQLSEVTRSFSAIPVLQSPRKNAIALSSNMESKATTSCKSVTMQNQVAKSKVACSTLDDRTIILEEAFTCKNQIETDDANSSSYHNNIGQLSEVTRSFSAIPVLQSPRKNAIALSSNIESKATCKSVTLQNQVESYKTDSFYNKEQDRKTFTYKKRSETHDVNSSFQENLKWFPKMAGTPPKTSLGKHSVMLKRRTDPNNTFLNNTFTCQNSVEVDEVSCHKGLKNAVVAASRHPELTRQFLKVEGPLARCHSFSSLPVVYNLVRKRDLAFEDIYRIENQNGSHRNVQPSDMVSSLVNSPGSRRFKRRASSNLFFSTLKRQKSADDTFIQSISNNTQRPMDNSSLLWQKTTDSLETYSPETKLQVKAHNTGC